MSISIAKEFIRRVQTEDSLRTQFESAWQGRKKWDKKFITDLSPVIPKLMGEFAPDQKEFPEENSKFWWLRNIQEEIHHLLFYKGDYGPFIQNYLEQESITTKGVIARISDVYYEENMVFLTKLCSLLMNQKVEFEDFKNAWLDFVCWTYHVQPEYKQTSEVGLLWKEAKSDPKLNSITSDLEVSRAWVISMALMISSYFEYGFCEDFKVIEKFVQALNKISERAADHDFYFTAQEYLNHCIYRSQLKPIKRIRDEKYWEEDDPNRWHVEPQLVYISFSDEG